MFENTTKEVIKSRKSKKDRQYNDHKKNYRRTNNDLQNTTQKIEDVHFLQYVSIHLDDVHPFASI
jgi:cytosine/uracil/thiamine/allantoin permease